MQTAFKACNSSFGLSKADGVECLLATVPDPFHTRLALLTDQTIEAIRKSAAATEWEFATQWLPWNDTVDPAEADPAKRAQERSDIRDQEKQPGVVVFRHADWRPGALLIFVVGETPTAGVNPISFKSRALTCRRCAIRPRIRIK